MGHYDDILEEEAAQEQKKRREQNRQDINRVLDGMGDYDLQVVRDLLLKWGDFMTVKAFLGIKL